MYHKRVIKGRAKQIVNKEMKKDNLFMYWDYSENQFKPTHELTFLGAIVMTLVFTALFFLAGWVIAIFA